MLVESGVNRWGDCLVASEWDIIQRFKRVLSEIREDRVLEVELLLASCEDPQSSLRILWNLAVSSVELVLPS